MKTSTLSDSQLINNIINGDTGSYGIIYKRYYSKVLCYVAKMVKDKELSKDITQDIFLKVLEKIKRGSYCEKERFEQWLMTLSRNSVMDYFRSNSRTNIIQQDEEIVFAKLPLFDDSEEDKRLKEETIEHIKLIFNQLPEEQKTIVTLHHYKKYKFKEIADMQNVSINTVLARMRYAIINMRKIIEKNNISLYM